MLRFWLILFFLTLFQISKGLDKGPQIIRICLDNTLSTANIFWQSINDNCSSFTKTDIYSSKDNGAWKFEVTITDASISFKSIPLSDINANWQFKLITYSACNGKDSFISNSQSIDDNRPNDISIDSVSFDRLSQKLLVAWTKNPSADTKGYRIYSFIAPVSNKIIDTEKTSILLDNYTVSNPSEITLATFDSCDLFGGISTPQKSAYLNGQIDTCARLISLNWQPYKGWASINQFLMVNKNNSGFTLANNLLQTDISFKINNIKLGDSLCYYVRTQDILSKKTSSSNTICFNTRALNVPKHNYLSNVSVVNGSIEINYEIDNLTDIDSIILERKEGLSAFSQFIKTQPTVSKNNYLFIDLAANISQYSYTYRASLVNKCKELGNYSNIGKSILLSKPLFQDGKYIFNWNEYIQWENGNDMQQIESSINSFTWNSYKKELIGSTQLLYLSSEIETDSLCFRIKNTENINSKGKISNSYSNTQCIQAITDYYFPEVINPFSENNILKVYGKGVDPSRGNLEVYNRWGQKIFETKQVTVGWNGKVNDDFVELGNYIYKTTFYDQQNKSYFRKGTVLIIR